AQSPWQVAEQMEGFDEDMQPLFRADPRQIANGYRSVSGAVTRAGAVEPPEVEPGVDDMRLLSRDPEGSCHELGVIVTGGEIACKCFAVLGDERERLLAVSRRQPVEVNVVALQRTENRHAKPPLKLRHQSGEKRIGKANDVRLKFPLQPVG